MKKRMLWASLVSLVLGGCTVYAQSTETYQYWIQLDVGKKVDFSLYEDADGKIPLKDETGEPYVFTTNEKGGISFELAQEGVYVKQTSTPDGYYYDDTVYPLEMFTTFFLKKAEVTFSSDTYPVEFELLDENGEVKAQWEADEESKAVRDGNEVVFCAGKKYRLRDRKKEDWKTSDEIEFEIPRCKGEEVVNILYEHVAYGEVKVHVADENEDLKDVQYRVYTDASCKEEARDINNEGVLLKTDANGYAVSYVKEGKYYLKQVEVDPQYYRNTAVKEIVIEHAKTTEILEICKKIKARIELIDAKSKDAIEGTVRFKADGGEFTVNGKEEIVLKRDTSYQIEDVEHPLGYYPFEAMTYTVDETKQEEIVITLEYVPYQICFEVLDEDTGEIVQGGRYLVFDAEDKEVLSFSMEEEGFTTSSLKEGATYTLHQSFAQDGYTLITDQTFSIPASFSHQTEHVIHVKAKAAPFAYIVSEILDEDGNVIEDADVGLFTDASCTKKASDLYGNVLSSLNADQRFVIRNGVYYAKMTQLSAHYHLSQEIIKCAVTHDSGIQKKITFHVEKVKADLKIVDDQKKEMENVQVQVLNDKKEEIHTFLTTSDNTDALSAPLERGKNYYIRIIAIQGQYTYDKQGVKLSIPVEASEEPLQIRIVCTPYVDLSITQSGHFGNTYGLYEDAECLRLAKDIDGSFTKKTMQEDGSISWLIRNGTYYLKEISPGANCYKNNRVEKIVADSSAEWKKQIKQEGAQVTLDFLITDENGKEIEGAEYEVKNTEGEVLFKISNSARNVKGQWLKASETYVIHEVKTPSGYLSNQMDVVYTVPQTEPNEVPLIEIKYEKMSGAKEGIQKTKVKVVEEIKDTFDFKWIIISGCAVAVIAGIFIAMHAKRNKEHSE